MRRLLLLAALLLLPVGAHASNCFWLTAPANIVVTNSYSTFSTAPVSVSQPFSFQCTPNTTAVVTLTKGTNSTSFGNRMLLNGTPAAGFALTDNQLSYNLYNPANQIWGDGTNNSVKVTFNAVPTDKVYDQNDGAIITALIPGDQDRTPGQYTDNITVTLSFGGGAPLVTTFEVSAKVIPECTVSTFFLSFGSYDPIVANASASKDADTSAVEVFCTKSVSATATLNAGLWSSSTRRMRHASNAAEYLSYEIYTDSLHSDVWNTSTTSKRGTSTSRRSAIGGGFIGFGRIPGGQDSLAGAYSDTVQAVVNY